MMGETEIFPTIRLALVISSFVIVVVICAPAHPQIQSEAHNPNNSDQEEYQDPDAQQDALLHHQHEVGHMTSVYDPSSRDFTSRCLRMAQYSGPKACEVFLNCCSEDLVLNKLNGDRCQKSDSTNGCTPNFQGDGIQWSQCKAYNCSAEITTTSTTTAYPPTSGIATNGLKATILALSTLAVAVIMMLT